MNRHFRDARYHLERAVEDAVRGLRTEFETVETRARAVAGRERAPELGRVERARLRLRELRMDVESEARELRYDARRRIRSYRGG